MRVTSQLSNPGRPSAGRLTKGGLDASELKRRPFYLAGLPFTAVTAAGLVYAERLQGTLHIVDAVGLPLLALLFGFLAVGLWQRLLALKSVEITSFLGITAMYVASMGYSAAQLTAGQEALWNLAGLGYWSFVLYALSFLVFGLKRGLGVSLGILAASLTVWLAYLAGLRLVGAAATGEAVFYQVFTANGLFLIILYAACKAASSQAAHTAQLRYEAHTDVLTELHNRRYLYERLGQEAERSSRQQHPLAVVMVDLDHFKAINDVHGHLVGDRVLQEVGSCLLQQARKMDVVWRWGGEEFMLLLPDSSPSDAGEVAERLRNVLEQRAFTAVGRVTASFGVASYRSQEGVEALLERADRALYQAKAAGRNRVFVDVLGKEGRGVQPPSTPLVLQT